MTQTVEAMQDAIPTNFEKMDLDLAQPQNQNRYAADGKLHVRFFTKPIIDPDASQKSGRPIYRDRDMVEIMAPGNKHNIVVRPTRDSDRMRFSRQYQQFKSGVEQITGTPLALAPFLLPSQVEELAYFKIRTIEQLADLSDGIASNMMGGYRLKQQAREWLAKQSSNESLMQRIAALEAQLADQKIMNSPAAAQSNDDVMQIGVEIPTMSKKK